MTIRTTVCIYGLVDPRDFTVRYIGASVDVYTRYRIHLFERTGAKKVAWLDELKDLGLKPEIKILENVTIVARDEAEAKWIQYFIHKGANLTNATNTKAWRYLTRV